MPGEIGTPLDPFPALTRATSNVGRWTPKDGVTSSEPAPAIPDPGPAVNGASPTLLGRDVLRLSVPTVQAPASPVQPAVDKPEVPGQVGKWIHQAKQILVAHGVPAHRIQAKAIAVMIQHESSGNPRAVNRWDYNAQVGTPSMGVMQVIRPTFNAYKLPGHNDIMNPVHNIIAGVRYALARYGSFDRVPGIRAMRSGRAYQGY